MRSILLTAALMLACGAASAQTTYGDVEIGFDDPAPQPPARAYANYIQSQLTSAQRLVDMTKVQLASCSADKKDQHLVRADLFLAEMHRTREREGTTERGFRMVSLYQDVVVGAVGNAMEACAELETSKQAIASVKEQLAQCSVEKKDVYLQQAYDYLALSDYANGRIVGAEKKRVWVSFYDQKIEESLENIRRVCAEQPPTATADRNRAAWFHDYQAIGIVEVADQLARAAEKTPHCSNEQAMSALRRVRWAADKMKPSVSSTSSGRFKMVSLDMSTVAAGVRDALNACQP